jgi:hypothetical protein
MLVLERCIGTCIQLFQLASNRQRSRFVQLEIVGVGPAHVELLSTSAPNLRRADQSIMPKAISVNPHTAYPQVILDTHRSAAAESASDPPAAPGPQIEQV